jgi:DNA-binding beta-propeller fold protein YncE
VIDLTANPPRQVATVEGGKQPSGLAINARGDLVLVANRADNSISVFSLQGTTLKLVDTVAMGEQVASVAITRDGKWALVTKFPGHKIALSQRQRRRGEERVVRQQEREGRGAPD